MRSLFLIACLLAQGAAAEEPLTLERALALARERNEVPAIARARMERASALTRQAWARLLPTAQLNGRYSRAPAVTREIGGEQTVIRAEHGLDATGSLQATLLDVPAFPLVMSAQTQEEAARHDAESLVLTLGHQVAASFFAVLSAEEVLAAAKRRVEVAEAALDVARRRLQSGLTGRQEVTRTELSLSNARLALNDAWLSVRTSRLALGELLAVPLDSTALSAPPPLVVTPSSTGPSDVETRPDLLALEAQVRSARLLANEPGLRLVPSLGVGASFNVTNQPGVSGQFATWSLFATANWEIYDGGLRYAQARARSAEADELSLTLSSFRRTAERELAEASVRIIAAQQALEEAGIANRLAQENAEQVTQLFAAGLATALERDDATVAAFEAQAELAQSTFALRVAQLEERRARGLGPLE